MKILVVGAGGVGGYFGGVLAKAGNSVTILARGNNFAAMAANGLKIESIKESFHLAQVDVVNTLEDVDAVDLVILAVKAWQVKDCVRAFNTLKANKFMILPLQNGVESYQEISEIIGPERALGGTCKIISYLKSPGHIEHLGIEPEITFGEWDNKPSERTQALAECLANAGIKYSVAKNIQEELWKKFTFLATYAGLGSLTGLTVGGLREDAKTFQMLGDGMNEIFNLARAYDIELPGNIVEKILATIQSMPAQSTSSMQRDVALGKPSELEYLSGAVVRLANKKNLAVPTHKYIYDALLPLEERARHGLPSL
jgi:2-dehydropantoate 2-reductase